ncbi:DUF829 domain containing protein [Scophthalmus maximus]|uniref:DUF829 domain containing protein n=1 Tax=Scophthalmus maximus TaxID=52904 RepID=A0A2U9B2E7_SCOMX|nr:uncharacterized protein LOC118291131 [Scophthalmus maximus]AWO98112.1 DUF829 domain containing protein [Scophthalmus maximus]KAF0029765.1 hypothetical protein F2P81_018870 [Scophthalmus maximus]
MGNGPLSGVFRADAEATPGQVGGGRFIERRIRNGITYYYTPLPEPLCPAKDSPTSPDLCPLTDPPSADPSSSPLLSDSPSHTNASSHNQPDSASTSRPLLLFFPWLGAKPVAVAKYRDLYLDRGLDVLVVRSGVMHFLWPRWGLDYGREVMNILEEPQFSGRPVLVHASSIGGYTFTQILILIAQGQGNYAGLAQRVIGQICDSLVVGTLEHMAIGLGKTLVPRLEGFVKNTALFYFWLFKTHTADFYNNSIRVFQNSPVTAPALFYFSEDDALCDPVAMEKVIDLWRARGVAVESRKWKESTHAAHMRRHPRDYMSTLEKFLRPLAISPPEAKV